MAVIERANCHAYLAPGVVRPSPPLLGTRMFDQFFSQSGDARRFTNSERQELTTRSRPENPPGPTGITAAS